MNDPHKAIDYMIAKAKSYAQLEAWKPVVGFQMYRVSNLGNIERVIKTKSGTKTRKVNPWKTANNYMAVGFSNKSKVTTMLVHRVVAEAWIGNADKMDVCHNNGKRQDNRLSNLRIDTRKGNMSDIYKHNTHIRGERCGTNKYSEEFIKMVKNKLKNSNNIRQVAREVNVPPPTVYNIYYKKIWGWLE